MSDTIHTPQSFKDLLQQERARAHRKGRQFSVVLFHLSEHVDQSKVVHPIMLPAIVKRIRKIDQVGFYDKNHIGLLLPHTSGDGARKMIDDLKAIHAISANIAGCEFYVYP
jgi:hypothetical protein